MSAEAVAGRAAARQTAASGIQRRRIGTLLVVRTRWSRPRRALVKAWRLQCASSPPSTSSSSRSPRRRSSSRSKRPRALPPKVLAVVIGGAFAIEFAVRATDGTWDWGFDLPLHLSDVVSILAPVALWTRKPLLVEVLYFWALTASLQAVITPDLHETVPSVFFFTYFVDALRRRRRRVPARLRPGDQSRGPHAVRARVRGHARDGRGGRDRQPDHGRQLHVPAGEAVAGEPAGPDGPVARLHRGRGRDRARPVRRARRGWQDPSGADRRDRPRRSRLRPAAPRAHRPPLHPLRRRGQAARASRP